MYNTIPADLIIYIQTDILPLYNYFDAAHQKEHAEIVIAESIKLTEYYHVNAAMVYTIAAYHDTGLCKGREIHHIESGKILEADSNLCKWFSNEQILTMKEAVEDHRASSGNEPRSIYGKIVAEADRDILPERILKRTVQFGLTQYPHLSIEKQYARFCAHLKEKYAEGGYLKLWLPESVNAAKLQELREIIANEELLRNYFFSIASSLASKPIFFNS